MTGELNKLFGRDFITAFFLPALVFIVGASLALEAVGGSVPWLTVNWQDPLKETALLALSSWICAAFLQALNRELFRFVEGYWPGKLKDWCAYFERRRFNRLDREVDALLAAKAAAAKDGQTFADRARLNRVWGSLTAHYPSEEHLVLPTRFGNAVRAYEDYARVVYGFESIHGWARLQALMSREFAEGLSRTRARVDLWLNTFLVLAALGGLAAADGWVLGQRSFAGLVLALVVLSLLALTRARSSAVHYGEQVKAAYDIHLPALARRLGFELSDDVAQNRRFWERVSQMMVFPHIGSLDAVSEAGLRRTAKPAKADADGAEEDDDD